MLPLLVSSVSFHWFDYKHHMYLHERGGEIERGFRKRESRERGRKNQWEGKRAGGRNRGREG